MYCFRMIKLAILHKCTEKNQWDLSNRAEGYRRCTSVSEFIWIVFLWHLRAASLLFRYPLFSSCFFFNLAHILYIITFFFNQVLSYSVKMCRSCL